MGGGQAEFFGELVNGRSLTESLKLLMDQMFRAGHTDIVLTYTFAFREEKCVRIVKIIET